MESVIRLLPFAEADGAGNMAADETLVHSAAKGIASLRLYGWTIATLSLGYFQPCAVRLTDSRLSALPFVRRPSGGATLVHHHELTYALALPAGSPWQSGQPWLLRMHAVITAALADLGLVDNVMPVGAEITKHGDVLCFQQFTSGDVLSAGRKIVGSAQRKYRQAFMQHGSILLAQSEHTPALPGIRETAGVEIQCSQMRDAIVRAFVANTGWHVESGEWTDVEIRLIAELIRERYGSIDWNEKR